MEFLKKILPKLSATMAAMPELFNAIGGKAPLFSDLPIGCKFYPRCRFRIDKCLEKEPELELVSGNHASRCIRIAYIVSV